MKADFKTLIGVALSNLYCIILRQTHPPLLESSCLHVCCANQYISYGVTSLKHNLSAPSAHLFTLIGGAHWAVKIKNVHFSESTLPNFPHILHLPHLLSFFCLHKHHHFAFTRLQSAACGIINQSCYRRPTHFITERHTPRSMPACVYECACSGLSTQAGCSDYYHKELNYRSSIYNILAAHANNERKKRRRKRSREG